MDKIKEAIQRALLEVKEYHKLDNTEIKKLSALVSAVAKSDEDIRLFFYSGVVKMAKEIDNILKEKQEKLLKEIKKIKDDDDILN